MGQLQFPELESSRDKQGWAMRTFCTRSNIVGWLVGMVVAVGLAHAEPLASKRVASSGTIKVKSAFGILDMPPDPTSWTTKACGAGACDITVAATAANLPPTNPLLDAQCNVSVSAVLAQGHGQLADTIVWTLAQPIVGVFEFRFRLDSTIVNGIRIVNNKDLQGNDYFAPKRLSDTQVQVEVLKKATKVFAYDVNLDWRFAGNPLNKWYRCGKLDPLIVNRD